MSESITVQEAIELYLENKQTDAAAATVRSHRSRLRQFKQWADAEDIEFVNEIGPIDMHRYKKTRSGQVTKVTVKTQLDTLRVFVKFLSKMGFVDDKLPQAVLSPTLSESHARDELLEPEAAQSILSYLEKYDYASFKHIIALLLYRTLLRRGALRGIDIRDCNFDGENPTISIKHRPETDTPLKNKADGERIIALEPRVRETVKDYISNNRYDVVDEFGREPLLTTPRGRPHANTIQGHVYALTRPCIRSEDCPHGKNPEDCKAARNTYKASHCPSTVGPHALRRGAITHWLESDVPIRIVSDRCNTDPEVISEHYDKRSEKEKAEQRRKYLDQV